MKLYVFCLTGILTFAGLVHEMNACDVCVQYVMLTDGIKLLIHRFSP